MKTDLKWYPHDIPAFYPCVSQHHLDEVKYVPVLALLLLLALLPLVFEGIARRPSCPTLSI